MLVRGNTRPNTPNARFARAAEAIMSGHYTCAGARFPVRTVERAESSSYQWIGTIRRKGIPVIPKSGFERLGENLLVAGKKARQFAGPLYK
jgi:hypothetical protein